MKNNNKIRLFSRLLALAGTLLLFTGCTSKEDAGPIRHLEELDTASSRYEQMPPGEMAHHLDELLNNLSMFGVLDTENTNSWKLLSREVHRTDATIIDEFFKETTLFGSESSSVMCSFCCDKTLGYPVGTILSNTFVTQQEPAVAWECFADMYNEMNMRNEWTWNGCPTTLIEGQEELETLLAKRRYEERLMASWVNEDNQMFRIEYYDMDFSDKHATIFISMDKKSTPVA